MFDWNLFLLLRRGACGLEEFCLVLIKSQFHSVLVRRLLLSPRYIEC